MKATRQIDPYYARFTIRNPDEPPPKTEINRSPEAIRRKKARDKLEEMEFKKQEGDLW